MFSFRRKKSATAGSVADTFMEATGGGWSSLPDLVSVNDGTNGDFIGLTLERAHAYALEHDIPVGQEFKFPITSIPKGISSPYPIVIGLMMRASEYKLSPGPIANETAYFTRLE